LRPDKDGARVLALHFGALGDFILSLPALGLLAFGPPPRELHLVGRPEWARLFLDPERIRDREEGALASLFGPGPGPELRRWLAGFELAAVFSAAPADELIRNLESSQVPRIIRVPTRPPGTRAVHVSDWQVGGLVREGFRGPAEPLAFRSPPARPGEYALIAPGSGGQEKRLPLALVEEVLARLNRAGLKVLVTAGPAEGPGFRRELAALAQGFGARLAADPKMAELAGLVAGAGLFVGPDSGVTHLAAALGRSTVAAFGPTDPRVWGPRGERVWITTFQGLVPLVGSLLESGRLEG